MLTWEGSWPNSLVRRPLWLQACSVKNKHTTCPPTFREPLTPLISMICNYHESNFWRDFDIRPNCAPPRLLQLNFSCLTWIAFIPVDTGGPSISRSIPGRKNPAGHNRGPEGVKTRRILLPHSYKLCTCLWPHFTCSPGPSAKNRRGRTTKFKRLHQLIAQLFIRKSDAEFSVWKSLKRSHL